MLKKRAPILGALFIVCERRISCPQDEFENKKYAQADIFCALRKLKPVLADFLLTQDEKQKSIKTARHKIPHEKFWHIGEAHLLLYGKDYKRVFAPNAAPCAWTGAFIGAVCRAGFLQALSGSGRIAFCRPKSRRANALQ